MYSIPDLSNVPTLYVLYVHKITGGLLLLDTDSRWIVTENTVAHDANRIQYAWDYLDCWWE